MASFFMMNIVFATNNPHKLEEIRDLLGNKYQLLGLKDLQIQEEIPEDYDTLEENASQKAWTIYNRTGKHCFADDTGLEVKALGGAPGVYSARYSRIGTLTFPDMEPAAGNIKKLLLEMENSVDRRAQFRTVIALVMDGIEHRFEGIIEGEIINIPTGSKGFGYDPVFRPAGYSETFAEMVLEEKNRISHRAKAIRQLIQFLEEM